MHRYIINIFNRRHIFSNVFIASLLISNHQPRFVSFRLPRIARDAYARRRENAAKVGNENASRPRNHVQIDVQILVARVSAILKQVQLPRGGDICRSVVALTHKP